MTQKRKRPAVSDRDTSTTSTLHTESNAALATIPLSLFLESKLFALRSRKARATTMARCPLLMCRRATFTASAYGMFTGKCGICGRPLTDPESVGRGIGPDCLGKLAVTK